MEKQTKSPRMEQMKKFDISKRVLSYETRVTDPQVSNASRILFRLDKYNWLDNETARVIFKVIATGNNALWNASGVHSLFNQVNISIGGTRVSNIPLTASKYLVKKSLECEDAKFRPSKLTYFQGKNVEFQANSYPFGVVNSEWVPNTDLTIGTEVANSLDVCVYLSELSSLFRSGSLPLSTMNDYVTVEFQLKPSASWAQIMLPAIAASDPTGWSVSSSELVADYIQPTDDMRASMQETNAMLPCSTVFGTSKTMGTGNATNVEMALGNKHCSAVHLMYGPDTNNQAIGVDGSYIDTLNEFKSNLRYNNKQYFSVDQPNSKAWFNWQKNASEHDFVYTPSPGLVADQDNNNVVLNWNEPIAQAGTGSDTFTNDLWAGRYNFHTYDFKLDNEGAISFENSTKFSNAPISVILSHNANIDIPSVNMFADVHQVLNVDVSSGGVKIVDSVPLAL